MDDNGLLVVEQNMVGGFQVTVTLPMMKGVLPMPLWWDRAAEYWIMYANTAPLWSPATTECAQRAWNRGDLDPSNMFNEGYTGTEKNHTGDLKATHTHTSALIHERLQRSFQECRLVTKQYRGSHPKETVGLRRRRRGARRRRKGATMRKVKHAHVVSRTP